MEYHYGRCNLFIWYWQVCFSHFWLLSKVHFQLKTATWKLRWKSRILTGNCEIVSKLWLWMEVPVLATAPWLISVFIRAWNGSASVSHYTLAESIVSELEMEVPVLATIAWLTSVRFRAWNGSASVSHYTYPDIRMFQSLKWKCQC